nr:hypothetical protein [Paraburkholderia sp. J41]
MQLANRNGAEIPDCPENSSLANTCRAIRCVRLAKEAVYYEATETCVNIGDTPMPVEKLKQIVFAEASELCDDLYLAFFLKMPCNGSGKPPKRISPRIAVHLSKSE